MNQAWYRVASMLYGYAGAAVLLAMVLLAARRVAGDRQLWHRVKRHLPRCGSAGTLMVLSPGKSRLRAGEELLVPFEGTLGSSHGCDVCVPGRRVHMRSAFFWMEQGELHMVALHRDGFLADDVPVEPGDEAVLGDGAVLCVGDVKMALRLRGADRRAADVEPYVTPARRSRAQQGHGDGLGAPGKGEARRERRLREKQSKRERR